MKIDGTTITISRRELRVLVRHTRDDGQGNTNILGPVHFDYGRGWAFATDGHRICRLNAEASVNAGKGTLSIAFVEARLLARLRGIKSFTITPAGKKANVACVRYGNVLATMSLDTIDVLPGQLEKAYDFLAEPKPTKPTSPAFSVQPRFLADLVAVKKAARLEAMATDEVFYAPADAYASPLYYVIGPWQVAIMGQKSDEVDSYASVTKSWQEAAGKLAARPKKDTE